MIGKNKKSKTKQVEADFEGFSSIMQFFHKTWDHFFSNKQQKEKQDLTLALEEAVVNIVQYAYPENKKFIFLQITYDKERGEVDLIIEDTGIPFNPMTYPTFDPKEEMEEKKIGGLGIFFYKKVVDSVFYERKGEKNHLLLKKNLM